jgi:tetratricopeptide (TPR) repeat protein
MHACNFLHRVSALIALALASGLAAAQTYPAACGAPAPVRGDYIGDRRQLEIVERYHFTPAVQALVAPAGGGRIGADIDYTLRSFPNHHRALVAMRRLAERDRRDPPVGAGTTVECYFVRATIFRRDDTVARMLYADYLIDRNRTAEAVAQLKTVETQVEDNPSALHNLGLLYAKMKDYKAALGFAHRAMALGSTRTDLREQLVAAGHWQAPAAASAPAAAEPPPAAASSAAR